MDPVVRGVFGFGLDERRLGVFVERGVFEV
jgi:hypothetical protein